MWAQLGSGSGSVNNCSWAKDTNINTPPCVTTTPSKATSNAAGKLASGMITKY